MTKVQLLCNNSKISWVTEIAWNKLTVFKPPWWRKVLSLQITFQEYEGMKRGLSFPIPRPPSDSMLRLPACACSPSFRGPHFYLLVSVLELCVLPHRVSISLLVNSCLHFPHSGFQDFYLEIRKQRYIYTLVLTKPWVLTHGGKQWWISTFGGNWLTIISSFVLK